MTKEQIPITVTQVHAVALAVAEPFAGGTFAGFHPRAVPVLLKPVLPHLNEIIFIYIALIIVCPYASTGRN